MAAAGAAIIAFCWQPVLATIGDDSVSYLVLARHLAFWRPDALAAPWTPYFTNFPPLFPALLAVSGGAYDLIAAHMVVAAAAIAAMFLFHAFARERLSSEGGALAVSALFLMLPGTWLALTGVLSESTYLALSLAALLYGTKHVGAHASARTHAILGLWMAAALLTRTAGLALVVAYALNVVAVAVRDRRMPPPRVLLPVVVPVAAQLAWLAVRPELAVTAYQQTLADLAGEWLREPVATLAQSWQFVSRGWIGAFAADAAGGFHAALLFGVVAVLALVGAVRAAIAARLDGWYVITSVAMLIAWKFNEDNSRRLFYPLLPLALLHAAETIRFLAEGLRPDLRRWIAPSAFVLLAAIVAPATVLIARKATDRERYFPDLAYTPSSMKDYYGTVNAARAREDARLGAAVLGGMSSLEKWTAPGARIMWVRPEYVAVLGRREGVPLFLRWDRATLARQIRATRTDFVIASRQYKNDLRADTADAYLWIARDLPEYLVPAAALPDIERGDFVLLKVDPERLDRYIRDTEGAAPGPPGPGR